jgi:hypothetical protein
MAETKKPANAETKRVYRSPVLKMYGAIRELTASGSAPMPEGTGQGNFFKMD